MLNIYTGSLIVNDRSFLKMNSFVKRDIIILIIIMIIKARRP